MSARAKYGALRQERLQALCDLLVKQGCPIEQLAGAVEDTAPAGWPVNFDFRPHTEQIAEVLEFGLLLDDPEHS